jgi:predicted DCC family thiol-disulfide oxidoreductase YuxK
VETWTKGQVELQPWQAIPDRLAALGLTAADGQAKAWFVDERGGLSGGAEAINRALRYCWWARPFTYLYFLPGLRQLEEWVYQWVADNRYRLPGSTPSCKVDREP